jgi:endoglucanase
VRLLVRALVTLTWLLMPQAAAQPRAFAQPADQAAAATPEPLGTAPFRASGGKIVDADGREVRITGVNWFGLETGSFAPHGLWARNLRDMLDQMVEAGFNTIRLPYSNQLFDPASKPQGIDYGKNPDLQGLSGPEIMDRVIAEAGQRGLKVILDRHRPTADAQSELWYTDKVPESRWIADWVMLAQRYKGNPTVIGADLHNEPHGPATWGDGNMATDWRLAAQRAGNAILAANPDWLIFVEGVERYGNDWYWWGGNLLGAQQAPVALSAPDKLVYSAHDYGPGVYAQQWFSAPNFPHNLPQIWNAHWAYLKQSGAAPVLVGEFGGRSVGGDREGVWQRALLGFLRDNGLSYTYWSWNPDSGDTGGVLEDDWSTLDQGKLAMLSGYQEPVDAAQAAQPAEGGNPVGQAAPPETAGQPPASAATPPIPPVATGAPGIPPGALLAPGGPFDPDIQHALQGIGGPNDPDPVHRQARAQDERAYLTAFGKPWQYAVYATGP